MHTVHGFHRKSIWIKMSLKMYKILFQRSLLIIKVNMKDTSKLTKKLWCMDFFIQGCLICKVMETFEEYGSKSSMPHNTSHYKIMIFHENCQLENHLLILRHQHVSIVGKGWSDFKSAYHIDHNGRNFPALQSYKSHKNCNDIGVFWSRRQMISQS